MNAEEVWSGACKLLKKELNHVSYETWIAATLKPFDIIENTLLLESVNSLMYDTGVRRYMTEIKDAVAVAASRALSVEVYSRNDLQSRVRELTTQQTGSTLAMLNPKYTFETFVTGDSNHFAHAVSLAVAEKPAKEYNPLFLYGGVGLGKTHLLHAIGHYTHELYPELKIQYITSEEFTNQMILAIQKNASQKFRDVFRNVDLLMMDDIQFIAGKHATEEEFFHTFNHLHEAGKQIVVTSEKPPDKISRLEERLCSRFKGGLIADIQRPDFETRLAILHKKAEFEGLVVSKDVFELIAEKIDTNVRELEGALNRLTAYNKALVQPQKIDIQLAKGALRELFSPANARTITCETIQDTVAYLYNTTANDLKSESRRREVTMPRQIAMYLTQEMLGLSLKNIGRAFNRDHTTVIASISKIQSAIKESPDMAGHLDDVRRQIRDNKASQHKTS